MLTGNTPSGLVCVRVFCCFECKYIVCIDCIVHLGCTINNLLYVYILFELKQNTTEYVIDITAVTGRNQTLHLSIFVSVIESPRMLKVGL